MKIIVTTSDKYLHLLPIFFYLYNKYWGEPFELVGYTKPDNIPDNCTFVSLGTQGPVNEWSTDLRKYFAQQPDWFVWMMEDTFLKERVDLQTINRQILLDMGYGRIDLTNDIKKREHTNDGFMVSAHPHSRYRLSTQPSVWQKRFLLQYLTPGLSPWDFETQDPKADGWHVQGFTDPPVQHNEGVRRFDIKKLNLDGMCQEDIDYITSIVDKW